MARDSHGKAGVTDLPAPWSLTRPAQCFCQGLALLCRLGAVLPTVTPGSPGITASRLLLNERCLFWMIRKAILQIRCLFVIYFVKFFASFKMLSIMMKSQVEIFFF